MADFFQWLSSGSISAVVLLIAFSVVVIATILIYTIAFLQGREISFYPPKIGAKPEGKKALSKNIGVAKSGKNNSYGISIDKPAQEQSFYSEQEDMFIEVSGEYEVKPESGKHFGF